VVDILQGRRVRSYDLLLRIANGLGIPREYLGLSYDGVHSPLAPDVRDTVLARLAKAQHSTPTSRTTTSRTPTSRTPTSRTTGRTSTGPAPTSATSTSPASQRPSTGVIASLNERRGKPYLRAVPGNSM
jgi:hypothetical protein